LDKTEEQTPRLLEALKQIYVEKNKEPEFLEEFRVYEALIPKLIEELAERGYELVKPLAPGSTATVWSIKHPLLEQIRALKLARPRMSKLAKIVSIIRAEPKRLASLNHQNIVKVYDAGAIELKIDDAAYSFPYFVMEYLPEVQDLDDFILSRRRSLKAEHIIQCFREVLFGLLYLHNNEIFHCDLKPANILVGPKAAALIADLGYAKHIPRLARDVSLTDITFTRDYAHPELVEQIISSSEEAANIAQLPRAQLRAAFDLFAFGRSMQEILSKLRDAESGDSTLQGRGARSSVFSRYQWQYLEVIAKRLLDGCVVKGGDELADDLIPGLPESAMKEIRFTSAEEALNDFEKLLGLYDLEGAIPELNPDMPSYIQIPGAKVPLTKRVSRVINHGSFRRLTQVTQLGFVSAVYPGATHTRFEHVLGSFSRCCEYIRALWYDQMSCLFRSVMSPRDLELCLLAALLHDIGQYSMAHDITEVSTSFAPERFTYPALTRLEPGTGEALADVIDSEWGINVELLLSVIESNENSTFRDRVLASIVSGPLDCDKLDYLKRDSIHLGVSFGASIDEERFLRNLTVVYQSVQVPYENGGERRHVQKLQIAEIGVAEKALAIARGIWRVRQDMFSQIYWQHTVRSLKAMVGYVVRRVLLSLTMDDAREKFWQDFDEWVLTGRINDRSNSLEPNEATKENAANDALRDLLEADTTYIGALHSWLGHTDDSLLEFLWQYADQSSKEMIRRMRARHLYRRIAVLSRAREELRYKQIYESFRTQRLRAELVSIESDRAKWQEKLLRAVEQRLHEQPRLLPEGESADGVMSNLRAIEPLVLVDVPVKATARSSQPEAFWYVSEDVAGVHARGTSAFPAFQRDDVMLAQEGFDIQVGKIRVFAAPEWSDFLAQCIPEARVIDILTS
jgi:HD superfamily phosphohydrolase/tRNA A-37 threonylcarbamoyl transferase component Bud32